MLVALCCRVFAFTFNFASARIKCYLAFTQKYLQQFCVSILWKMYEGRLLSLKTQLKIEFLVLYTSNTKVLENIFVGIKAMGIAGSCRHDNIKTK